MAFFVAFSGSDTESALPLLQQILLTFVAKNGSKLVARTIVNTATHDIRLHEGLPKKVCRVQFL